MFRSKILKFILLIGAIVGFNQAYSDIVWEILDLGTLETDGSEACLVNDEGQICGKYHFQGISHWFLWKEGKELVCLDLPENAELVRMNNVGQIIGSYKDQVGCPNWFFWDPTEGITNITKNTHIDDGYVLSLTDMNDKGQVVGCLSKTGGFYSFVWQKGLIEVLEHFNEDLCLTDNGEFQRFLNSSLLGNSRDLDRAYDRKVLCVNSCAMGINNNGVVVGYCNYPTTQKDSRRQRIYTWPRAVIWENGKIREIAPYYKSPKAIAINNFGCVLLDGPTRLAVYDMKSGKISPRGPCMPDTARVKGSYNTFDRCSLLISEDSLKTNINLQSFMQKASRIGGFHRVDTNRFNWRVGSISNEYGERHAALLRPIVAQSIDVQKPSEETELEVVDDKKLIANLNKELEDLKELQEIPVQYGNNSDGSPMLHAAIKKGDKRAVELLLKHGADANSSDTVFTALHYAALENQVEIAQILIDNGANVEATVSYKALPTRLVHQLDINIKGLTPLHLAAYAGNAEMIGLLHERGADLNKKALVNVEKNSYGETVYTWGDTPLHFAAGSGHYDAVVALVTLGADVNVLGTRRHYSNTCWDQTPLDIAASVLKYEKDPKNLELITFLVEHGAKRQGRIYNPEGKNAMFGDCNMCPVISGYLKSNNS